MEHGPVLLHLGLHKTGTTWLQERLVPGLEGLDQPLARSDLETDLVFPGLGFDASDFWRRHGPAFEAVWERGHVAVVSHEGFSGLPGRSAIGATEAALRLAETFPDAHAVFFVREQRALMQSVYNETIRRGGRMPFDEDFLQTRQRRGAFAPYLNHESRYRLYRLIFGRRVTPLLHEDLVRGEAATVAALLAPFEVSVGPLPPPERLNRSLSRFSSGVLRRSNWLLRRAAIFEKGLISLPGRDRLIGALRRFDGMLGLKPWKPAGPWLDEWARSEFAASNRAFGAQLGRDLEPLGYCVA